MKIEDDTDDYYYCCCIYVKQLSTLRPSCFVPKPRVGAANWGTSIMVWPHDPVLKTTLTSTYRAQREMFPTPKLDRPHTLGRTSHPVLQRPTGKGELCDNAPSAGPYFTRRARDARSLLLYSRCEMLLIVVCVSFSVRWFTPPVINDHTNSPPDATNDRKRANYN